MADHMHTQIRDAIIALVTGLASTGSNVFKESVYDLPEDVDLPAWGVFAVSEESEVHAAGDPPILMRLLDVALEGVAQGTEQNLPDTLSQMAKEAEPVMSADLTLGGLVITLELTSTEYFYRGQETTKPVGAIRLTYTIEYRTTATDPTTSV